MEANPLASIAKSLAIYEQDISSLSRSEKLSIRNQIVIAMIGAGASQQELAKTFSISERNIRHIIQSAYEDALNWYRDLPKNIRIGAFKMNVTDVFNEIIKMKSIRDSIEPKDNNSKQLKFDMGEKIALLEIKYDKMLSEGPTLERIKEQGEILDELIKDYQKKMAETSGETNNNDTQK